MGSAIKADEEGGRQAERHSVRGSTRLKPNEWSSVEVTMLDLSELGFRAACEARLRVGGTVSIEIPEIGAVEAQVEWQRGGEFGARFYGPIDLHTCGWTSEERHNALAHLLVARAGAKAAGRAGAEAQLRRRILAGLPMHKGALSR
jgi:hypothetical protein